MGEPTDNDIKLLAISMRLIDKTTDELPEGVTTNLTRHYKTAVARIDSYAPDADADARTEAIFMGVSFLYDPPPNASMKNWFSLSGAKGTLAPWRKRRVTI